AAVAQRAVLAKDVAALAHRDVVAGSGRSIRDLGRRAVRRMLVVPEAGRAGLERVADHAEQLDLRAAIARQGDADAGGLPVRGIDPRLRPPAAGEKQVRVE